MIGIFHCLFYIHSFSWEFAKWWHCCPFPMSSRAGLYACMKVDVFLLIEALSQEISCRNEACAVEAWDFSRSLCSSRNDSGAMQRLCHSFLWLYYIFWTQARRKAWKTLPGTDEGALESVWIILTMRSFRLFGSYSINPYFLKPPALGGRSLRTHRTDWVSGALMDSSLRDGLQYRQEPGIFMWPLPGPFLYSHLMNIIYENIEK